MQSYKATTTMPLHLQAKNAQLMHQVLAKTLADYIVRDFAPKQSESDQYEIEVVILTPEEYAEWESIRHASLSAKTQMESTRTASNSRSAGNPRGLSIPSRDGSTPTPKPQPSSENSRPSND